MSGVWCTESLVVYGLQCSMENIPFPKWKESEEISNNGEAIKSESPKARV